jgi:hypothetical protein
MFILSGWITVSGVPQASSFSSSLIRTIVKVL